MTSGAKCSDEVTKMCKKMQITKDSDDPMERPRIIKFTVEGGVIDVKKMYKEKELEGQDVHKLFTELMSESECCYVLYDCRYVTKETPKSEMVFVMWTPDTTKVKDKMTYSSGKQAIMKVMKQVGVKHDFELHDCCEHRDRCAFAHLLGNTVIKLEDHDVD